LIISNVTDALLRTVAWIVINSTIATLNILQVNRSSLATASFDDLE